MYLKAIVAAFVAAGVCVASGQDASPAAKPDTAAKTETNSAAAAKSGPLELSDLQAVIAALRARYLDPSALSDREINEAAVNGILEHLGNGAKVIDPAVAASISTQPDIAKKDMLGESIHYIRLGRLAANTAQALDAVLEEVPCEKTNGLILDLRFVRGDNFEHAADVAGRFVAEGAPLFLLKFGNDREPRRFSSRFGKACTRTPLIVLINSETAGSAEALAAALHDQQRAVLVGSVSAGSAVERVSVPLVGGKELALAVAQVVLPGGGKIFPSGLMPDVPVKMELDLQRKLLLEPGAQKNLRASLEPKITKRRLNEAELVRELSPDDKKSAPAEKPAENKPAESEEAANQNGKVEQPLDTALVRALDILKGIRVLRQD